MTTESLAHHWALSSVQPSSLAGVDSVPRRVSGERVEWLWAKVDETTQREGKPEADDGGMRRASSRPEGEGRTERNGPLSIRCQDGTGTSVLPAGKRSGHKRRT